MLDDKICELREKLNESIITGEDYTITYQISVELDELIAQYYKYKKDEETKKPKKAKNTKEKVNA